MAPLLVIIGQQIFRIAGTAAAKKAAKMMGGRIVKKVPKEFSKKKIKDEFAFQKLFGEKKPTTAENIGNLFVKKSKKVKTDSPGRTKVDEGISTGQTRLKGHNRGEQVKGAGKLAAATAAAAAGVGLTYAAAKKKDKGGSPGDKTHLKVKEKERLRKKALDEKQRKRKQAAKNKIKQADKLEKLIRKKTRPQRRPWTLTDIRPQNRPSSVNKNNKK